MSTSDQSSSSQHLLTQYQLMLKKEQQRAKTRARMAKFRSRLKQLPPSEQEAFKARARVASARYRATLRQRQQDCANGNKLSQLNEWSLFNTPTCS